MKNNIRVERAILRISQQELANKIGVTRQTINAMELEKYIPSGVLIMKIASVCNKKVEEIFWLEDKDWK